MEVVMRLIHDPSCIYLHQHLTTEGVDMTEPVTKVPEGWTFLRQLPKKVWKTEVQELIVTCFDHLLEVHAHMSSFVANMSFLAKIADPETLRHGHEGSCSTDDSDQCHGVLSESGPRSTPKDDCRREAVQAGESPAGVSHMDTMVQTHPASRCSHLVAPQMQVFQWWHCQGGLHHV